MAIVVTLGDGVEVVVIVKPLGLEGRVQRIRVRVGTSVPLANPYP